MMEDNGQLQMQVGDVVQMPDGLYRVLEFSSRWKQPD